LFCFPEIRFPFNFIQQNKHHIPGIIKAGDASAMKRIRNRFPAFRLVDGSDCTFASSFRNFACFTTRNEKLFLEFTILLDFAG